MNDQLTINQNMAACIHSMSNWGENVYTNVCTGAVTVVPWGAMDTVAAGLAIGITGVGLIGLVAVTARHR